VEEMAINYDEENEKTFVAGCMAPTFQGVSFDSSIISNLTARLAVQTLLREEIQTAYPDSDYNLINWNSRGEGHGNFPAIEKVKLPVHRDCIHS
jgi:hypothetical protein